MPAPASRRAALPTDSHVHSEWSWDASRGSMERTCARALELGLPGVAFTEHTDFTTWTSTSWSRSADGTTAFTPRPLDLDGYLGELERCRAQFPTLRILTGVELGEPHWHTERIRATLGSAGIDRVLGSQHSVRTDDGVVEVGDGFALWAPYDVVDRYLDEVERLVRESDLFGVLAHLDYVFRAWPADAGPVDLNKCEEHVRHVLGVLARTGRALEVNTRLPLDPTILRWWHQAGGDAVSFGSDAHEPDALAARLADAAALAESVGFRSNDDDPTALWTRA